MPGEETQRIMEEYSLDENEVAGLLEEL